MDKDLINDLDEAIKHCEEKAKVLKEEAHSYSDDERYSGAEAECLEYAFEHEQLAEWLKELKSFKEGQNSQWIPITYRPMDDEKYETYTRYWGETPKEECKVYFCPMPDDEERVLITTCSGDVCEDIYHRDEDGAGFEDHDDPDEVVAWMPLPEAYKKGGAE